MALPFIDPKEDYDRKNFVKFMSGFTDFEKYINAFDEKPGDSNTRKKLGAMIHSDPKAFATVEEDAVREVSNAKFSGLEDVLGGRIIRNKKGKLEIDKGYVEHNLDAILKKLNDKQMWEVIQKVRLYKTGNEKLDAIGDSLEELRLIAHIEEEKGKGIKEYVAAKLKKEDPETMSAYSYSLSSERYTRNLFEHYKSKANENLNNAVNDNGKIDKNKLLRLYKNSLKVALDEYDAEAHEGDKGDIYENVIRPYYLEAAKTLFPAEKTAEKMKDPKERKRAENKARRKSKNMPV